MSKLLRLLLLRFDVLNRLLFFLCLWSLRLASFEELFFLLPSQFFIFSLLDTLFDGFGSLVVEVPSELFMELLQDMGLVQFVLNAGALGLFDLAPDIIQIFVELNPRNHVDLVKVVNPAYHNAVGVSLEIEERLQFLFEDIVACVDSMGFELLADNFLDEQIVRKKPLDGRKRVLLEVKQNDSDRELLLPAPMERLTEIGVVAFDIYSPADKFL